MTCVNVLPQKCSAGMHRGLGKRERQTEHALNKELHLCGRVQYGGVYISLHGSHSALARTPDAASLLPDHARLSFSSHVNKPQ